MVPYISLCLCLGWRYNYSGAYKSRYMTDLSSISTYYFVLGSCASFATQRPFTKLLRRDMLQWRDSYQVESESWIRLGWRLENSSITSSMSMGVYWCLWSSQAWEMFIAHARPKDSFDTFKSTEISLSTVSGYWEGAENSNKGFDVRVKARDSGK